MGRRGRRGCRQRRWAWAWVAVLPWCAAAQTETADAQRITIFGRRISSDVGPLPGLRLERNQIPANLQTLSGEDVRRSGATNIADLLNSQLQSISINDYTGNPFQRDISFRGFSAGPQIGTPQGLSVFFDGVRVNEPFGDVVNWDLLPMNAIDRLDLFPGSNPVFGLNTLGGALSLRTKSGFNAPGVDGKLSVGSFGRRHGELSVGANNETLAGFAALNLYDEDGWRDDSPSRVRQLFVRGDLRHRGHTLTLSGLVVENDLIGNGLIPIELFRERPQTVFTSPDQAVNRVAQLSLQGAFRIDERYSVTGQMYRRDSRRRGLNGDAWEGFEDLISGTDIVPPLIFFGRRLPAVLPLCRLLDANGDGRPDSTVPLNGPQGTGCDLQPYETVQADGPRNGGHVTATGALQVPTSGVVAGTPIGLLTRTQLAQVVDGVGLQFNANLDTHKWLVGAAYDRSRAAYRMTQQLAMMDARHRVYAAPDEIAPEFGVASIELPINDFDGKQATASLYFSDTWTVREDVHLTIAGRYNHTRVRTNLNTRTNSDELGEAGALARYLLCRSEDPASCETTPSVQIKPLFTGFTPTREDLTFTSFNPALGGTWQVSPTLNVFGNLSRGARVPSVVELGCAFDPTPVPLLASNPEFGTAPRSLVGPTCNLPTALSGDPFLPQIRATSGELGARGRLGSWEWNASLYRTDLKDDLYFVGIGDGRSYFDTIGRTRRQGLELGFRGRVGPVELKADYAFVEAKFRSKFYMISPHNSSADFDQNSRNVTGDPGLLFGLKLLPSETAGENRGFGTYRMIRIDPGATMPGIPRHHLNTSVAWKPVPEMRVALSMSAQSGSIMRGNENNRHQPAGTDQQTGQYICNFGSCAFGYYQLDVSPGRPFRTEGRVPGFAVFGLDLQWQVAERWTLGLQVSNLFDRQYFTAGRLGITPFSPSVVGAIGPSGWNYNSAEWQNTSFVGPGAPRGVFLAVSYALGD